MSTKKESEPLLQHNPNRHVMFPIQYNDLWTLYEKAQSAFWTTKEINLSQDKAHFLKLNKQEQNHLKLVLSFFANADGIVMENLCTQFFEEIEIPEIRAFYSFQLAIECIHSEMYAILIHTLIPEGEKETLFTAHHSIPSIKQKTDWATKWMNSNQSFQKRLVAFAVVEGIFFSSSFASIFWFKTKGILPGLCLSNEFISRDEASHCEFATTLYRNYIKHTLSYEEILEIVLPAVELEKLFSRDAIQTEQIGMNQSKMEQYIELVADHLLIDLGYPVYYKAKNPFPFMEQISIDGKTNFFERRVSEYKTSDQQNFAILDNW
tara:strand:+ start:3396 stop:4358 length:963 start_codon:yes stop_codon:yes gene_type:complete